VCPELWCWTDSAVGWRGTVGPTGLAFSLCPKDIWLE
jgi:hypothetical protein